MHGYTTGSKSSSAGVTEHPTGQPVRRRERVQTRLLRREVSDGPIADPLETGDAGAEPAPAAASLVIVGGAGIGKSFALSDDYLRLGRGDDQDIRLAHDDTVSRRNHAIVGFVEERGRYAIFDGGKVNPIWVNNKQLKDIAFLSHGDIVRVGETSLRFEAA